MAGFDLANGLRKECSETLYRWHWNMKCIHLCKFQSQFLTNETHDPLYVSPTAIGTAKISD